MPSTITTFFTFSKGICVSSEMNTNFDNFRGDLLPINEDTASASNLQHDLGSSSHYWRDAYINDIYMQGATSGTTINLSSRTDLTTGGFEIKFGADTIATFLPEGLLRYQIAPMTVSSSDPGPGIFRFSETNSTIVVTAGSTATDQTVCSMTMIVKGDGLTEVGFTNQMYTTVASFIGATGASGSAPLILYYLYTGQTTTAMTASALLRFQPSTTTVNVIFPPQSLKWYLSGLTAGSTIFEVRAQSSQPVSLEFRQVRFYAFER